MKNVNKQNGRHKMAEVFYISRLRNLFSLSGGEERNMNTFITFVHFFLIIIYICTPFVHYFLLKYRPLPSIIFEIDGKVCGPIDSFWYCSSVI